MSRKSKRLTAVIFFLCTILQFTMAASGAIKISGKVNTVQISIPPQTPPVSGVDVRFLGTQISSTSGADGSFTLQGVPEHSVSGIRFSAPGYVTSYTQYVKAGAEDMIDQAFLIFTTDIYNSRIHGGDAPAHINGKGDMLGMVTNSSGVGIQNVAIQASYLDTGLPAGTVRYFSATFNPEDVDGTGANGYFAIYNLDPGRPVLVRGTKPGIILSWSVAAAFPDAVTLAQMKESLETADLSGVVFTESGGGETILPGASITLPGLGVSTLSGQDGGFMLNGMVASSLTILKSEKDGYADTYIYGCAEAEDMEKEEDESDIEVFMPSQGMLEDILDAANVAPQAGTGHAAIDTMTAGVEFRLYDDTGTRIDQLNIFYFSEEGNLDPLLEATEPDGTCLILNLQPGYYYAAGYKDGFEFPLAWLPVFAGGITMIDLESNTPVAGIFKSSPWEGQVPASGIFPNASGVPVLKFNIWASFSGSSALLDSLTFSLKGTGDAGTALSAARLFYDRDNNGTFDAQAGTGLVSEGLLVFDDLDIEVGQGLNNNWQLLYDFNGTALHGTTFGADLLFNKHVVSSDKATGLDITCQGDPVTGNLLTVEIPAPARPVNILPASGATGVSLSDYILGASPYSMPPGTVLPDNGEEHRSTLWQVRRADGTYQDPLVNEQAWDLFLTSFNPSQDLQPGVTYYWRVRYMNRAGTWSEWSDETWFTAVTESVPPAKPVNQSPSDQQTEVEENPTLVSSPFEAGQGGSTTHNATQWQVASVQGDYSSPVYDSGRDINNLLSISLSAGILQLNTSYWWRVRYQDGNGAWSGWSGETSFTTEAVEPGDINGDESINISDVILCLRMSIGLPVTVNDTPYEPEYPGWLIQRADINGEGGANISDVILILRKSIGLDQG